jgi:hypothetical protein
MNAQTQWQPWGYLFQQLNHETSNINEHEIYKIINVQIITKSMNMKKVQYDHLSTTSCGGAKIGTCFGLTR